MSSLSTQLYSIGYATKPMIVFIEQLKLYGITAVTDIRSVPYSKVFHEYHQESLRQALQVNGIRYVYLGDELGPRSKDPAHYNSHKQIQFDRLMKADLYKEGLSRVFGGLEKGFRIALVCAEKDPATCHRSLLVGWDLLHNENIDLPHITHEGELQLQSELEYSFMEVNSIYPDMLLDESEAKKLAYQKQCENFAYRIPKEA